MNSSSVLKMSIKEIAEDYEKKWVKYEFLYIEDAIEAAIIKFMERLVTPMMEFKRREWVGLTLDEKAYSNTDYAGKCAEAWQSGVEWAEVKLKEKNE